MCCFQEISGNQESGEREGEGGRGREGQRLRRCPERIHALVTEEKETNSWESYKN